MQEYPKILYNGDATLIVYSNNEETEARKQGWQLSPLAETVKPATRSRKKAVTDNGDNQQLL